MNVREELAGSKRQGSSLTLNRVWQGDQGGEVKTGDGRIRHLTTMLQNQDLERKGLHREEATP